MDTVSTITAYRLLRNSHLCRGGLLDFAIIRQYYTLIGDHHLGSPSPTTLGLCDMKLEQKPLA